MKRTLALLVAGCASPEHVLVLDVESPATARAVLTIDGAYDQDVVVARGRREYRVISRPGRVDVSGATLHGYRIEPLDLDGPILRPRDGLSDLPLLMYFDGAAYHVIFSNEDGGTGIVPTMLMERYGRTTDIEWVCRTDGTYQGAGHRARRGDTRVLRVATPYNTVEPAADGRPRMRPAPIRWDGTGEQLMDAHPWTYAAAHEEMVREGKTIDARDYVIVETGSGRVAVKAGAALPAGRRLRLSEAFVPVEMMR